MLAGECCWKITLLWRAVWTVQMPARGTHGIVSLILCLAMENRWEPHMLEDFISVILFGIICVYVCVSLLCPQPPKLVYCGTWRLITEFTVFAAGPYREPIESSAPLALHLPPTQFHPFRFPTVYSATQIILIRILYCQMICCSLCVPEEESKHCSLPSPRLARFYKDFKHPHYLWGKFRTWRFHYNKQLHCPDACYSDSEEALDPTR